MADKLDMVWDLSPHTAAKHAILSSYLGAWFPKLATWNGRILFVDGFAGPGEYSKWEPGSPIIALNAAIEHRHDLSNCELKYLFIEEDKDRYQNLAALVEGMKKPAHVKAQTIHGTFSDTVAAVLDGLGTKRLAPAFIMIDPFGVKGIPYNLVEQLAEFQRTELLVSFMYEPISRWMRTSEFEPHLNSLFGCEDWKDAISLPPAQKRHFLLELYMNQLGSAGMSLIRSFEMLDRGGRTEYYLIYATHHIEGLKAMKAAMWSLDNTGSYRFSDATDPNQATLFQPEPDYAQLKQLILERFRAVPTSIEEIEEFVILETAFRETHIRRNVLASMESAEELEVTESPRKKRLSYPPGTKLIIS